MNKLILTLISIVFLQGCIAKFKDISGNPEYSDVIGTEYVTSKDLLIFGYTLKVEKEKKLHGYSVHDYPGIGGSEIMSREVLSSGTNFTVERVEQCSNCFPLPSYIEYIIKFQDLEKYSNYRVAMDKEQLDSSKRVIEISETHNKHSQSRRSKAAPLL